MQLIPAIDLLDGQVVRLFKGDFAQRKGYGRDPVAFATRFRDAGATALHVVDLNAARGDAQGNRALVCELAALEGLTVQCGGGVRDADSVAALLAAGAGRVVIGSLAVRDPPQVVGWLERFGAGRIVLALDVSMNAAGEPELLAQGWREATGMSLWPLLERYAAAGLVHLLCTDSGRDGTLQGPNLGLYRRILERHPALELQASGGIGGLEDLRALRMAGIPAAILGRALLEERVSLRDALQAAA